MTPSPSDHRRSSRKRASDFGPSRKCVKYQPNEHWPTARRPARPRRAGLARFSKSVRPSTPKCLLYSARDPGLENFVTFPLLFLGCRVTSRALVARKFQVPRRDAEALFEPRVCLPARETVFPARGSKERGPRVEAWWC